MSPQIKKPSLLFYSKRKSLAISCLLNEFQKADCLGNVFYFDTINNMENKISSIEQSICFFVFDSKLKLKRLRKEYPKHFWILFFVNPSLLNVKEAFENLNPQGIWAEKDINADNLVNTLSANWDHFPLYTNQINILMSKKMNIDLFHLKLLEYLDLGVMGKNLPEYLPSSSSTIERAKRKLKILFDVEGLNDCALIRRAKENGYL
jgi:hypothetical protein